MRTELVVGLGERLYAVETRWGRLPESMELRSVSKLALDSQDRVYVFQRTDPPVVVFDPSGDYAGSFATGLVADGHGICLLPDDGVVLVDRDAHEVLVFDPDWSLRLRIGGRHRPRHQAPFNFPTDVAVAPDGSLYVADGYGNSCVHRFAPDGQLLHTWGRPGRGPGEFTTPHGIFVDARGRVLVGDRENHRVQVFTADGEDVEGGGPFTGPMDVWVDREGMVFVTDGATHFETPHLSLLRPDGELIGRCRSYGIAHGMGGSRRGELFLAGALSDEITKLVPLSVGTA